jgi:hypothetical protein
VESQKESDKDLESTLPVVRQQIRIGDKTREAFGHMFPPDFFLLGV